MRRVLARSRGREIAADFESEEEYLSFCGAVMEECISTLMRALTLEELIQLWQERNIDAKT